MLIKKEEFVKIINSLQEISELITNVNQILNNSKNDIIKNFCNVSALQCQQDDIIKILSTMFNDVFGDIEYFIYDLEFGKKYHEGCYTNKNGENIDLSNAETLYDRLLESFNEEYNYTPRNEFDSPNNRTKNFIKQKELMKNLSVTDLIKVVDYVDELAGFIPKDNEVLDYLIEYTKPLIDVFSAAECKKNCPHCGGSLYLSDLPQYDYVCPNCDKNF